MNLSSILGNWHEWSAFQSFTVLAVDWHDDSGPLFSLLFSSSFCQTPVQSDSTAQVSQTISWLCFPPVTTTTRTRTRRTPHQNPPEGSVLLHYRLAIWHKDLTHKIKTMWSAMDGQPPSRGWSSTIQNLPEGSVLQTFNLAPRLSSQN